MKKCMRTSGVVLTLMAVMILTAGCPMLFAPTVKVTASATGLAVGGTSTLTASTANADAAETYTWSVSPAGVVSLSATTGASVTATAVADGDAVVTVTGDTTAKSASVTITVATVIVDPATAEILIGEEEELAATSSSAADTGFTWASSDDAVASVDAEGVVTGVAIGTATITATGAASGVSGEAAITVVNAAPQASISIEGVSARDLAHEELTTSTSSGLSNVGIGRQVYLEVAASDEDGDVLDYTWSVASAPDGSTAGFLTEKFDPTAPETAIFVPDVEGTYTIQVDVTDGVDSSSATQNITAGTWIGIGAVNKDGTFAGSDSCSGCHNGDTAPDKITPWLETGHATRFSRQLDGEVSSHASEGCIGCHTVGYDATLANGGFDDVQADAGWTWPETLEDGNWDDMVANFPEVAKLSGIQCENCHGPASQHAANAFGDDKKMDVSLGAGMCGQCHQGVGSHSQEAMWEVAGHADESSEAFRHWDEDGAVSSSCARCHSGVGFIELAENLDNPEWQAGEVPAQTITCSVCHDPHDDENPYQLRMYDTASIPATIDGSSDWELVRDLEESATCMSCHNGRRTPESGRTPHYALGGSMLLGRNGVEYGVSIQDSVHSSILGCVDCHMAPSPGTSRDGVMDPGEEKLGGHTFKMVIHDETDVDVGMENVENACGDCHIGLEAYNRTARGDYDGDGDVEGVQDEVQGLLDAVHDAVVALGAVDLGRYPYWSYADTMTEEQIASAKDAIWNYEYVKNDHSMGIHNTAYAVGLLQLSVKDLTGADIPDATLRY